MNEGSIQLYQSNLQMSLSASGVSFMREEIEKCKQAMRGAVYDDKRNEKLSHNKLAEISKKHFKINEFNSKRVLDLFNF